MTQAPRKKRENADIMWTSGKPANPEQINRMPVEEARVYAYLAVCAASRMKTSLHKVGSVRGANRLPVGADRARTIIEDLYDQGLVRLPGLSKASVTTPLAVVLPGMAYPNLRPGPTKTAEVHGVRINTHLVVPYSLPEDLRRQLVDIQTRMVEHTKQQVRDVAWLEEMIRIHTVRLAAFNRWASLEASKTVEREAARLARGLDDMRRQLADKLRRAAEEAAGEQG